ncbi:ComEC family competence protein [Mycobacterium sp. CBMA271]|uniref:ComEC/Rec2 family competence protein n=1 Tax=unclassified Mycobacteroides TaxID=2618759 RepID=UPI0013242EE8|nr:MULTISPECIES: ComEC/Rec2 family competence protein [unclassified Mycobacteroides]MUM16130.1 competence protein [Mycobacteroides sp. CBMA 326]MUM22368.1 ComEC family competence protein [Mycobacteroides sp. CBMA 271]
MSFRGSDDSLLDLRLVPAALAAWVATAGGILWPFGYVTAAALGCGTLAVQLFRRRFTNTMVTAILAVFIAGVGFSVAAAMRYEGVQNHPLRSRMGHVVTVQLRVADDPRPIMGGRAMVRADLVSMGEPARPSAGAVTVFGSASLLGAVAVGDTVQLRAAASRPSRRDLTIATLTATGDPQVLGHSSIHHTANGIRDRFVEVAGSALPAEQAALLPALVLGDTSALDADTIGMFRTSGLTHLMAVSGANVSIVCGTVLLLGRLIGPRVAVVLAALVLVGFVMLVRPSPSVLRAAVMGAIGLLAVLTSRRRQAVPALAATVLVLLAVSPGLAVDIGFALSATATAALVVLAPRWSARLCARGWPKPFADALCIAAAAQLVTAPLIAAISGSVSVASVAANLVAGLVIAPITILGTAAAGLAVISPAGAGLFVRFCGPELWWLLRVAEYSSAGGSTAIPVPSGAAGFGLVAGALGVSVLLWRRRWFRGVAWCGALCVLALIVSARLAG